MKKGTSKKKKKKHNLEDAENLSFTEVEVEDLNTCEAEKDNISEGDFDDRDVISRVKLF